MVWYVIVLQLFGVFLLFFLPKCKLKLPLPFFSDIVTKIYFTRSQYNTGCKNLMFSHIYFEVIHIL